MAAPAPIDLSLAASGSDPSMVVLYWPPGEEEMQHLVQGFIIMRREGGVLLTIPDHVVEEESLQLLAQADDVSVEALVGPFSKFQVPMMITGESGTLEQAEELYSVVVMDLSVPAASQVISAFPEEGDDQDLLNLFVPSDVQAHPDFAALDGQVKSWLSTELAQRVSYYTADEGVDTGIDGQELVTTPKATPAKSTLPKSSTPSGKQQGPKATPKRATVATLSQQLESLMSAIPGITSQLSHLSQRQDALEKQASTPMAAAQVSGFKQMAPGKTSAPVSGMLTGSPKTALQGLPNMIGPPPPQRQSPARGSMWQQAEEKAPVEDEDPFLDRWTKRRRWNLHWARHCSSRARPWLLSYPTSILWETTLCQTFPLLLPQRVSRAQWPEKECRRNFRKELEPSTFGSARLYNEECLQRPGFLQPCQRLQGCHSWSTSSALEDMVNIES